MTIQSMDTMIPGSAAASPPIYDKGLLRGSLGLAVIALVGFGLLYSLAGVGLGQALFPSMANGSLIERDGKVVGSSLVAQPFVDGRYFQPRPSAAGYNPMAAAGSNQARSNPEFRARIDEARRASSQLNGVDPAAVPSDLITQSGGGMDPHISPEAAVIQVERVARTRGVEVDAIKELLLLHTQGSQLGVLGQPRVNVLELNLALDAHLPLAAAVAENEP